MKNIFIIIIFFLFACSPTKQLIRLQTKHPELFKTDTVYRNDTVLIHDTIILKSQQTDTVLDSSFSSANIQTKDSTVSVNLHRKNGKIYVYLTKKGETIYIDKKIPIKVPIIRYKNITVKEKFYTDYWFYLFLLLLTLIIIIKIK